jgi:hypothetical protein
MKLGESRLFRKQLFGFYEEDPHHDPQCRKVYSLVRKTNAHSFRHSPPGINDRHSVDILQTLGIEQELHKAAGQNELL